MEDWGDMDREVALRHARRCCRFLVHPDYSTVTLINGPLTLVTLIVDTIPGTTSVRTQRFTLFGARVEAIARMCIPTHAFPGILVYTFGKLDLTPPEPR